MAISKEIKAAVIIFPSIHNYIRLSEYDKTS